MSNPDAVWEAIESLREIANDGDNLLSEPERGLLHAIARWLAATPPREASVQSVPHD